MSNGKGKTKMTGKKRKTSLKALGQKAAEIFVEAAGGKGAAGTGKGAAAAAAAAVKKNG